MRSSKRTRSTALPLLILFLLSLVVLALLVWLLYPSPNTAPASAGAEAGGQYGQPQQQQYATYATYATYVGQCTTLQECRATCSAPSTQHNRIVAFVPNFDSDYPGFHKGKPQNYTHAIIGFVVPYHVYMGKGAYDGCSTLCNLSYGSYFGNQGVVPPAIALTGPDAKDITQQMVKILRADNPDLKILLSFGGWNLDNLSSPNSKGCEYLCKGDVDPLDLLWNDYQGNPVPQDKFQCTPDPNAGTSSAAYPSDFCQDVGGGVVSDHLIALVDGIQGHGVDIDFENTKIYNDPSNPRREGMLQYIVDLTRQLRTKKPGYILTHSPMLPYAVDTTEFHNAYLFYKEVLLQVRDLVDFINVQFYNNDPEDSNPAAAADILRCYQEIVDLMGGDATKVTVGMCAVKENTGVCTYCQTSKYPSAKVPSGAPLCSDPTARLKNIIEPLSEQYKDRFGGIMFWNTAGDDDGIFSTPIHNYFHP